MLRREEFISNCDRIQVGLSSYQPTTKLLKPIFRLFQAFTRRPRSLICNPLNVLSARRCEVVLWFKQLGPFEVMHGL